MMFTRLERRAPWKAQIGCTFVIALLTASPGLFIGYMTWTRDHSDKRGAMLAFAAVWIVVGLLVLLSGIHQLFAVRSPETIVEIDPAELTPGAPLRLRITQPGPLHLRSLHVNLAGEELQYYYPRGLPGEGSKRSSKTRYLGPHRMAEITQSRIAAGETLERDVMFTVPSDVVASVDSVDLKIRWTIEVWGRVAWWPDFMHPFPVRVGRPLTSHERLSGQPWDASYHDGPAPWDVGGPQEAVERLASQGAFAGAVLGAGCGSGENALHIASLGLSVLGVDVAETALARARETAASRGIENVTFAAADALHLETLGRTFDTVLDCGLFHAFDAAERAQYAASVASVTARGGTLYILCFGDEGPDPGPHPVSRHDLQAAFNAGSGWEVVSIEPERLQTRFHANGAAAFLARVRRV